ncbi:MAG: DUF2490 domain-containing protein [Bacteroidota bacterium]
MALFMAMPFCALAQNTYQVGTLPAINVNKKISDRWKLNFKWESRQGISNGSFGGESISSFDYILSDLSLIGSTRIGLGNSLAMGYLIRLRENRSVHRSIQQYTIIRRYSKFRLAHRIASDQTYDPLEATAFRLRYRIGGEFPLRGETINPREFYLKVNHEYLHALQQGEYDLEIRAVPLLGYMIRDDRKLEIGTDYRLRSFLDGGSDHVFWISINCFISI